MQATNNILIEAFTEALETMAFMMTMPPEETLPAPDSIYAVTLNFTGPSSGKIIIVAGVDFARCLTANVLGVEPDDETVVTKNLDAFKELLNTTCGVLLPRLATVENDIFDITIPEEISDAQQITWHQFTKRSDVTILDVDGFPVAVLMELAQ